MYPVLLKMTGCICTVISINTPLKPERQIRQISDKISQISVFLWQLSSFYDEVLKVSIWVILHYTRATENISGFS